MRDFLAVSTMIRAWNGLTFLLIVGLQIIAAPLVAQPGDSLVTVRGLAYDSLAGHPLRGAVIRIAGRETTALADANGRFALQGVTLGEHLMVMEHPLLDSIGLPEIAKRVRVSTALSDVVMAIPSFQRMWNGVCGNSVAPKDSGFLYGAIRDASNERGLPNARIAISWVDIGVTDKRKIQQKRLTFETHSDSTGAYVACGVPDGLPLQIVASAANSSAETAIEIPVRTSRVQRRDLMIVVAGAQTAPSMIRGRVSTDQNMPLANVRVMVDGFEATRTDSGGNFSYAGAPAGTHQIEFVSIGSIPVTRIVDVAAGGTASVFAQMQRVTTLEKVDVKATAASEALRSFDERKRMGFGYSGDSSFVMKRPTIQAVFREFPSVTLGRERFEPGITLSNAGHPCEANYFVDGFRVEKVMFYAVSREEVAWVELYPRATTVPREFMAPLGKQCGAAVIYRKQKVGK